jgi:hypothetical protein
VVADHLAKLFLDSASYITLPSGRVAEKILNDAFGVIGTVPATHIVEATHSHQIGPSTRGRVRPIPQDVFCNFI